MYFTRLSVSLYDKIRNNMETEEKKTGQGASITAPGQATGRRKEAIARVRLVPGTGEWKINGRTLEDYFPNKLHQQLVN